MKQFLCSNFKKKFVRKYKNLYQQISCAERNKKYIERDTKFSNIIHGQRQVLNI